MAWAKWRHTLNEAKRLAVKAIDEYNFSTGHYADFVGTMVRAWLYLLQAEFQREQIDYRYKDLSGDPILIDGEPKLWDTLKSVKERFPAANDPVRINLELFIALRNKVEHRYEHALKAAAGGRAHALVINFEQELVAKFGVEEVGTSGKFQALFGFPPRKGKVTQIATALSKQGQVKSGRRDKAVS